MRFSRLVPLVLISTLLAPVDAHVASADGGVSVTETPSSIILGNGLVSREFSKLGLATEQVMAFGEIRAGRSQDVSFGGPVGVESWDLLPAATEVESIDGGLALTRSIGLGDGSRISRRDEMFTGIAGMRSQITLDLTAPLVLERYVLDAIATMPGGTATAHSFRAGADWRYDAGWDPIGIGDDHPGYWRQTTQGQPGANLNAPGEWIEVNQPDGSSVAIVAERHDYASSRVEFEGTSGKAQAIVDLSRDLVYTGPIEESVHVESPEETSEVGRIRVLPPGRSFMFEPSWVVLGRDTDETASQFQALLSLRNGNFDRQILFNTNNVDTNAISTGAKDDANFETFQQLLPAVREAGMTTFVFDDGWQAISGDWCPDSEECPEPRRDRDPTKFRARFPDAEFRAVRELLAGDPNTADDDIGLGLWMTPMEFHPSSNAFKTNPQWACMPVGAATAGLSVVQPDSSSNEAGLGVWNPLAMGVNPEDPTQPMRLIDWIESRIDRAVDVFGATYFKFDFLVWLDCGGAEPVDQYQYREAFIQMVDRLIAKHPHVLFTIDETNDYRMFPYESAARGATWFQNGSPALAQTLHNVWNLSPFVPGYVLGQGVASNGNDLAAVGVDAAMAAGLTSHMTVWRDLRVYSAAQRAQIKVWSDFYLDNVDSLATMTYPLLEDPLLKRWTALQPWDSASTSGWVLAYRQADTAGSKAIPVKGLGQVPDGTMFDVTRVDPATGSSSSATLAAADLRSGGLVASTGVNGYALYRITPAS